MKEYFYSFVSNKLGIETSSLAFVVDFVPGFANVVFNPTLNSTLTLISFDPIVATIFYNLPFGISS